MKRHIDQPLFDQFKDDFRGLIKKVRNSCGELDLRLRDNYVNLYYKGNSVAKISIKNKSYIVRIHKSFVEQTFLNDSRIPSPIVQSEYLCFQLTADKIDIFFQSKYLGRLCSNVKKVNNGEEITYEQMLITDNLDNRNVLIIDRQVTDRNLSRKRLDLLALKHVTGNQFQFLVLEVKLGNNKELQSDVGKQLSFYINHITNNFSEWKQVYEQVYEQLHELNLYPNFTYDTVDIIEPVEGKVIVGSYSGIAKNAINRLNQTYSGISVQQFRMVI